MMSRKCSITFVACWCAIVAAIFVSPGFHTRPGEIIAGATAALIRSDNREMLITSHHVIQEFMDQKISNAAALLALFVGTNQTVELPEPECRIINEQPHPLDLVSLRYSGLSAPHYPEKACFHFDQNEEMEVVPGEREKPGAGSRKRRRTPSWIIGLF